MTKIIRFNENEHNLQQTLSNKAKMEKIIGPHWYAEAVENAMQTVKLMKRTVLVKKTLGLLRQARKDVKQLRIDVQVKTDEVASRDQVIVTVNKTNASLFATLQTRVDEAKTAIFWRRTAISLGAALTLTIAGGVAVWEHFSALIF